MGKHGGDILSFFPGKLTQEQAVAKAARDESDHQAVMLEREAAAARELAKADGKRKPGRPRKIRTLVRAGGSALPSSSTAHQQEEGLEEELVLRPAADWDDHAGGEVRQGLSSRAFVATRATLYLNNQHT